ncbi:alkaline phosphatase [Algoriphagus boritolerans]|uniref:Alkaline phosphatase n=2 Tax=Algoriphagus TaxID=246875 RepID=A0A1H5XFT4_9BACT|nr:alkaline phosphatase [Algoriphagus boritolerans]SEG10503.1 alkaline phosphatase [Algoriphagus boritolerans DSM 17298 = JCM 18970]
MKNLKKGLLVCLFLFPVLLFAQQDFKLHSHNDYLRNVPFWEAFGAGAASIEVDVILQNGNLMVAHEAETIKPELTLRSLYLEPIQKAVDLGMINAFGFHLLIDSKTEAYSTLEAIVKEVADFEGILFSPQNPKGLKLIVSGNRPKAEDYSKYPEWVFFDYQSKTLTADLPWKKIGIVSLSFRQFSVWNGKGRIVESEKLQLEEFVAAVHSFQKPVRFWAAPDSKSAWKAFYDMGVDFINTDQPAMAQSYLSTLSRNIFSTDSRHEVYQPTFATDGKVAPVKNIILMIGDGNGLAQISAGLFVNGGKLNLAQLKNLGLIKTQAADDFTTDSAAGATAFATGKKTNNRALSVDTSGKPLSNLPEILAEYNFNSGIITTDQLTGATPASFYAHHSERDDLDQIASYLPNSKLDLFIGGGRNSFADKIDAIQASGFEMLGNLDDLALSKADRIGYFSSIGSNPSMEKGRGDFLIKSAMGASAFFKSKNQPFFLMIESAMIDSGGHANSTSTIVTEVLDFDRTVGEMVQFADKNPGTLLIITADHETGGVSIPQGNREKGEVELAFHSDDHTGILVPIFAYGPHSDDFMGIYENNEVFEKVLGLVKKYHSK